MSAPKASGAQDRAQGRAQGRPQGRRSLAKAVTYRVVVMSADFVAILLFTRQLKIAAGFMVVSNLYAAVLYFLHERAWAHIRWGLTRPSPPPQEAVSGSDGGG